VAASLLRDIVHAFVILVLPDSAYLELFTKHTFDKIFPVPQFMFNHNNLI